MTGPVISVLQKWIAGHLTRFFAVRTTEAAKYSGFAASG
jgi:hypothetical protein